MKSTQIIHKRFLIILALLCCFSGGVFAQKKEKERDTLKGFDFFFNAGMYKAHKFNADYYRGLPDEMDRHYGDPDFNYIMSNKYWYDEIMNWIDDNETGIILDRRETWALSTMHYKLAFYFEVGARYRFTESLMLSILFGQARLTANGVASFGFNSTEVNTPVKYIEYPIMGKERRNIFQVQLSYLFFTTLPYVFPFIEIGGHLNSVKVVSSEVYFYDRPYDMVNRYGEGYYYDPGTNPPRIDPHIGGIGYGFMAGFGIRLAFNSWAAIEPVVQISADKLNLSSYGKIRPNYNFMVRLVVGDKLFSKKK